MAQVDADRAGAGSRTSTRAAIILAVGLLGAAAACTPRPPAGSAAEQATLADVPLGAASLLRDATPDGFALAHASHAAPPSVAPLLEGRSTPLTLTVGVYRAAGEPVRTITATLAAFADGAGAVAMYNRWFAENAFMAAAERNGLDVGDQAECFRVQWPPFHAAIARADRRFVLAEADTSVPIEQCRTLLRTLVDQWR